MNAVVKRFLIFMFVDNVWLHKWWRCHRMSERSFFVSGRQYHICARCTGIFWGYLASPFIVPWRHFTLYFFPVAFTFMIIDGITQLCKWRMSNNTLRVVSGFCFGITFLPFTLYLIGGILKWLLILRH